MATCSMLIRSFDHRIFSENILYISELKTVNNNKVRSGGIQSPNAFFSDEISFTALPKKKERKERKKRKPNKQKQNLESSR